MNMGPIGEEAMTLTNGLWAVSVQPSEIKETHVLFQVAWMLAKILSTQTLYFARSGVLSFS
jgi:hypothetical protein